MKKTTLICQNCDTKILRVESCKDLIINCSVCGQEILLNVEDEAAVIKMRPPNKRAALFKYPQLKIEYTGLSVSGLSAVKYHKPDARA